MADHWGNDEHGPGGDPSWLGGKNRADRARSDAGSGWSSDFSSATSSDFSSDFSAPSADFSQDGTASAGARRDPLDADGMAPSFGEVRGDAARSRDRGAQSSWTASFGGQDAGSRSGVGSTARQLSGILFSIVVLVMIAVFLIGSGTGSWWLVLFAGIPLLSRVARLIRRNLGD